MEISRYIKRILRKLISNFILFYLNIGKKIFGIEFVTKFLSQTSLVFLIPSILTKFGAKVGENVNIKNIIIDNALSDFRNLKIGSKVFIGRGVFFDLPDEIIIEDEAVIAANVQIFTHEDVGDRIMRKYVRRKQEKVIIGRGTWIGAGCVILCGTVIEPMCIVAAGAVVKGRLESGWIYGGVPAKKIKRIWEEGKDS
ncbi:MAG: acyltransferase [Dictyoglomus thermophilum]|uniref:acyltransferase n=1 Tax=Dictyoglomus thermophilum TaxID=14 RepID=UPI0016548628|nr:acyltransferase [Dictyoglomus thermophilum]